MTRQYFIDNRAEVKRTDRRGLGVVARGPISEGEMIERSPFSGCWATTWAETPENLRKIVFSYPQNSDNYVIGLGYLSIYNHDDNNNAIWLTENESIVIVARRNIKEGEEITINYGEAYWSGGWPKY